jgi:hypothetical protein
MKTKTIQESNIDDLTDPFNLYIYAFKIIKGKLPEKQHKLMENLRQDKSQTFVHAYFNFLENNSWWSKIKKYLKVFA